MIQPASFARVALVIILAFLFSNPLTAQEARLLRQPDLSANHIVFAYGGDLWIVERAGGNARRLTSTPAVESNPHFSPDGRTIAFTSNRSGDDAVYTVPIEGGQPTRLTWYPAGSYARGWTRDGQKVLYSSSRETAPARHERLWLVSRDGGPSTMLPSPWGHDASYSDDGRSLVIDRMARWDVEWKNYRGGQNTPLTILSLGDLSEVRIPNERTTDLYPLWMNGIIYFVSDRDWTMNVWSYNPSNQRLTQVTRFTDGDVKWLSGHDGTLIIERDGWLHTLNPRNGRTQQVNITVLGDFPWAETRWEDVSKSASAASLSPSGKRAVFEARGEIFTVPVEKGDSRNLTRSSDAADRFPVWSPDGGQIAWFSDANGSYSLMIAAQDALSEPREISIGESKLGWEPAWSPDGKRLAFVDDDTRVRIVEIESGNLQTIDHAGANIERGNMGLTWSPDSQWLAYTRTFPNHFHRVMVWSVENGTTTPVTDAMADAVQPAWDRDGRHLYFLASTNLALGSGWANTSTMQASPSYAAYVTVLRADDPSPFPPQSDEEPVKKAESSEEKKPSEPPTGEQAEAGSGQPPAASEDSPVRIDFEGIERRIQALPIPVRNYRITVAGPKGTVFIGESIPNQPGMTLHKFSLEKREAEQFATGATLVSVSNDGKKLLFRAGTQWRVVGTERPPEAKNGNLKVDLRMKLDRLAEWHQIFDEAWRYERDYFYDPGMHGNDWNAVRDRYRPLIAHVRHRSDLNYILDQVNGELAVGHSFVFGGDMPEVEPSRVGLLGADLVADSGGWKIDRIYTLESWNPGLSAPLDRPGLKVDEGHYLVGVDGVPLTASDDPYRLLDGTAGRQTVLHINTTASMQDAWTVTVEPISSEDTLRQRAWVEDNRRRVDELSSGRLAYVWVPNTGGAGVVSFDRYYFAQQDREGAVIDERFNGGGLLDDYMVDLMTRKLRAAITNEVPDGAPFRLPAGILGPKVLLINEMAGSGGDFFPWVFRHQNAGPLIGKRTWGGLVKSSVHYRLIDGGALTAPDNAVFDPNASQWIGENIGIPPDINVELDAQTVSQGRDPQLERAVQEALRLLEANPGRQVVKPPFSTPARRQ